MLTISSLEQLNALEILALNGKHERETSPLTITDYQDMVSGAFYARGIAPADAFLIAFDEKAQYDSPNFLWFRERYPSFAYIDRVITAEAARGKGYARTLYEDLFATARKAGKPAITCEVNIDPPNPGSDAFHARMGFVEVGNAILKNGKMVRYMAKRLS
ncbi:MAG: GNAT family N-acetyltransferase [Alphaproteobacteria bacterium]|nr:GNAT family N-acetyltransferase [Alphaproteobacteria bacterium]